MNRAHGIDLSHWQTYYRPQANPPRPVDFVIQKITEAVFRDTAYSTIKEQIQSVPIRGGYHYFRGQWYWKAQMDLFLSNLDGYHFWALDVEKAGNYTGLPILNKPYPGFVETVPLALEYLKKYSDLPGLIYTGAGMMDWLLPIITEVNKYDLWVAHYWNKPNPDGIANYYTIRGADKMRRDWKFWQYDANGQGGRGREYGVGSLGLDLNVFNGSIADLVAWAKPKPAPVLACPACGFPLGPGWSYTG
jgi:GH25 family lysozyme M1 (1,4-beta-N-acetylmuramidase)